MVLSPIEKQIKEKIERMGTALKNWNIQINYGIKTGFNEAFIVDSNKKGEILASCQTEEEREKTDKLIRPILRGRDIGQYKYDFANRYLIATFPSKNYNIEDYPAIKRFLEGFKPKLKQTGELLKKNEIEQVILHAKTNGISLKENELKNSRKKTNNKWFETQDSISYWEDFSKQKIVWKRVGSILRFSYDDTGTMALDSTCFATGSQIKFLVAILNSKMGKYLMKDSPQTGTGDLLISVQAIEPLKVPIPDSKIELLISHLIDKILDKSTPQKTDIDNIEQEINRVIYKLYNFDEKECCFIESQ